MIRVLVCIAALTISAAAQTLAGRVVEDHTGSPVVSANVRVSRTGDRYLAADLETDRDGRFVAEGLPAGEYRLEIIKNNYSNSKLTGSTGVPMEARLVRRGVITGQVRDQRNQPVAGVWAFALPKGRPGTTLRPAISGRSFMAVTNAEGGYRIFNLPPGEYAVGITYGASTIAMGSTGAPGTPPQFGSGFQFYPTIARPDFLPVSGGEEHRNIDFTLLDGTLYSVSGKVDTGQPDAYFYAALINPDQPTFTVAVATTDKDGNFRFTGIPAGNYQLVAASTRRARTFFGGILSDDPLYGRMNLAVTRNVEGLSLKPEPARTVAFTLHPAATCPETAQLKLIPLEDWGSVFDRTLDLSAEQPTSVKGLAPSRYAVDAEGAGKRCFMESEAQLDLTSDTPSRPIEVRLSPAGSVRGRLSGGGGAFRIALVPSGGTAAVEFATAGADSGFEFSGLRPGRYHIGAFPTSRRSPNLASMFEFEVRGGSTAEIDLVAPEGGVR